MITIRTLTLVVALSAVTYTDVHAKSKKNLPRARVSKRAKRDVSMVWMTWGAVKTYLGLRAGFQVLEYLEVPCRYFVPVTRNPGENYESQITHVTAMEGIFRPGSWHEAGLKNISYWVISRHNEIFPREVMDSAGDTYNIYDRQSPIARLFMYNNNIGNGLAAFVTVASIPLAYIAYRLVKSGINTWRDEFIASAGFEDIDTVEDEN